MILPIVFLVLMLVGILDLSASASIRRRAKRQAAALFAQNYAAPEDHIPSKTDLDKLPAAIGNYLRRCGALKTMPFRTVRMRQKGAIRFGSQKKWKPWEGKCFIGSDNLMGLVWYADVTLGLLQSRILRSSLLEGVSSWSDVLWGIRLSKSPVEPTVLSAFLKFQYCTTLVWHPHAWMFPGLQWALRPDGNLDVKLAATESVMMELCLDTEGLPKSLSGVLGTHFCTVSYSDYQEIQGVLVPMCWTMDIRQGLKPALSLQGQLTDSVTDGPFAWW